MCSQHFLLYSLITLWISIIKAENSYEAKLRLENGLLENYHKAIRPVLKHEDNVTITVGISLNHIKEMDDKNQVLSLSLWFRQKWHDPRLIWQPSKFRWVNTTQINAGKLWTADLKVYNEAETRVDSGLDQFQTKAIVSYSGDVKWMAPAVMKLSCQVDVKYFPYDTQVCKIKIGSWTYDGFSIDVQPESYTMDVSKSPSNPEWQLVSTSVKRNVENYPCCSEPFPDVTYIIKIKRRMQSYWINFLFPGILLTIMTMMTFLTPASDTGERVSLVLTSLVSMFVFLKMIAQRTPASETIPLLSTYYIMLSLEIALIFYSVCVSVNAFHKHPALGDMPGYVRTIVLNKLGKIWGLNKERRMIKKKLDNLRNYFSMKNGSKEKKTNDNSDAEISSSDNSTPQKLTGRGSKIADIDKLKMSGTTTASSIQTGSFNGCSEIGSKGTEDSGLAAQRKFSKKYGNAESDYENSSEGLFFVDDGKGIESDFNDVFHSDSCYTPRRKFSKKYGNRRSGSKSPSHEGSFSVDDERGVGSDFNDVFEPDPGFTAQKSYPRKYGNSLSNCKPRSEGSFSVFDPNSGAATRIKFPEEYGNSGCNSKNRSEGSSSADNGNEFEGDSDDVFGSDSGSPTQRKFPKNFRCSESGSHSLNKGSFSVDDSKEIVSDPSKVFDLNSRLAARKKFIRKYGFCSCASLVRDMVKLNKKLLFSLDEIVYFARRFDKTSSEKEHWLLAAAILDRTFLVLFVVIFVVISVVIFLV